MNKIHRVIYNHALNAWVAVSELTKAHKKHSEKTAIVLSSLAVLASNLVSGSAYAVLVPADKQLKNNPFIQGSSVYGKNGGYLLQSAGSYNAQEWLRDGIYLTVDNTGAQYVNGQAMRLANNSIFIGAYASGGYGVKNDGSSLEDFVLDPVLQDITMRDAIENANERDLPNSHNDKGEDNRYGNTSNDPKHFLLWRKQDVVIGRRATSYTNRSVAVGAFARAFRTQSVVIGGHAKAGYIYKLTNNQNGTSTTSDWQISGKDSIAIGYMARTNSDNAIVIGVNALAWNTGENTNLQYIPRQRKQLSDHVVGPYLGLNIKDFENMIDSKGEDKLPTLSFNEELAKRSIVIGFNAFSGYQDTVTVGNDSQSLGHHSVAIGRLASARDKSVAIGANSLAAATSTIAIGNDDIDSTKYRDIFSDADLNEFFAPAWENTNGMQVLTRNTFDEMYRLDNRRIYSPNLAGAPGAISIGSRTLARGTSSTSVGAMAFATSEFSTTLGIRSFVSSEAVAGIAAGDSSRVFAANGIAVGNQTEAASTGTVAYGYKSHAVSSNSTAIGNQVLAGAVIDKDAFDKLRQAYVSLNENTATDRVAAAANLDGALSTFFKTPHLIVEDKSRLYLSSYDPFDQNKLNEVYKSLTPEHTNSDNTKRPYANMVAIGSSSLAMSDNSLATGYAAFANSINSISFGTYSSVGALDGTVDPSTQKPFWARNSIALGVASYTIGRDSFVAGTRARSRADRSILIGTQGQISHLADDALAVGYNAKIGQRSAGAIVLGNNVTVADDVIAGLSIGVRTSIGSTNTTVNNTVDPATFASGDVADHELSRTNTPINPIYNALALGNEAKVSRLDDWQDSQNTGRNAIAIGNRAHAYLENSVALGVNSRTDYTKEWLQSKAWSPLDTPLQVNSANTGVISIGAQTLERRITNLAPGARDTDGVNVSQLRAISERLQNLALINKDKSLHFVSIEDEKGQAGQLNTLIKKYDDYKNYVEYQSLLISIEARQKILNEVFNTNKIDDLRKKADAIAAKPGNEEFATLASELLGMTDTIDGIAGTLAHASDAERIQAYETFLNTFQNTSTLAAKANVLHLDNLDTYESLLKEANYLNSGATGTDSIAFGFGAKTLGLATEGRDGVPVMQYDSLHSIAMGTNTNVGGNHSYLIGSVEKVAGQVGDMTHTVNGNNNLVLGADNTVVGNSNTVLGAKNHIEAAGVKVIGAGNNIVLPESDPDRLTNNLDLVVLAHNFNSANSALFAHSVVLGSGSTLVTDNSAQTNGSTLGLSSGTAQQLNMKTTQTIPTPYGVVSVGAPGQERRIQNVAKGHIGDDSHDLINGSQLFAISSGGSTYQGSYTKAADTTATSIAVPASSSLKLLGKDTVTDSDKTGMATDNLYTVGNATNGSITVLMKKAPAFSNLTVGDVTLTGKNGDAFKTLSVNNKKITGVASALNSFGDLATADATKLNTALTVADLKTVADEGVTFTGTTGSFKSTLGSTVKFGTEPASATSTTTAPGNLTATASATDKSITLTLNNSLQNLSTIKGAENSSQLGFTDNGVAVTKGNHTVNLNVNNHGLTLDQNGTVSLTGLASIDTLEHILGQDTTAANNADASRVLTAGDVKKLADQGLTFRDSTTDTSAPKSKLGANVKIVGDATAAPTSSATNNVYVKAETTGTDRLLTVGIAKELQGITSISNGDDQAKLNFVDSGIKLSKAGVADVTLTVAGTTTDPELNLHNAKLTGVESGIGTANTWLTNANPDKSKVVNTDDVINVAKTGFNYTTDVANETVTQALGGGLSLKGASSTFTGTTAGQNIQVAKDGAAGLQVKLASNLTNIHSMGKDTNPNVTLNTDGSIDLGNNKSVKLTAGNNTLSLNNKVLDGVKSSLAGTATTPLKDRINDTNKNAIATLGDLKAINSDGLIFKANTEAATGANDQKTALTGSMQLKGNNSNIIVTDSTAADTNTRTLTMSTAANLTGINTIQKGDNGPALHLVDKGIGINGTKDAPHVKLTAGGSTTAPELNLNGAQLTNLGTHTAAEMRGTDHGNEVATLGDLQHLTQSAWTVTGDSGDAMTTAFGDTLNIKGEGTVTATTAANNLVVSSQAGTKDTDPKATLTVKLASKLKGITKVANGTNEVNFNDNGEVGFKTGTNTITMKADANTLTLGNGKTTGSTAVSLANIASAITSGNFADIANATNTTQAITAGDLKLLNNAGITFKGNTNPTPDDNAVSAMGSTVNLTGTNGISTVAADTTQNGVTTRTMTVKLDRELSNITSMANASGSSVTFGDNHTTTVTSNGKDGVSMQAGANGLTLSKAGATTDNAVSLTGVKSGLGDGSLADLAGMTTGLDKAVTAGDLKKVLNAQYTVETNQTGNDGKVTLATNGTLKVLSGNGAAGTFTSDNLSTYKDGTDTVRVAMKKNPSFTSVKLGDTQTLVSGNNDTLTFGNGPVEITNVLPVLGGTNNNDSAVTVKDLNDKAKDITDKLTKPPFKNKIENTPGGESNTGNTPVTSRIQSLRAGAAGPVVYTDSDGKRIVVGADGKYYDYEQAKGKVQLFDEKTQTYDWYTLPTKDGEGLTKVDPAPAIAEKTPAQLTLVNSNGKVDEAFALANVKSVLGDTTDASYTPVATLTVDEAKKLISQGDAGKTALLALSGAQLDRAATLGDLQALAVTGFSFTGNANSPLLHQETGSTLKIKGDSNVTVTMNETDKSVKVELNKTLTGLTSIENAVDGTSGQTTGGKLGFTTGGVTIQHGTDASVTMTPTNGQLTLAGQEVSGSTAVNVGNIAYDMNNATTPDTAAVAKKPFDDAFNSITNVIGGGDTKQPDNTTPGGNDKAPDDLNGQVNALRMGTAGPVVYTDAEGKRLILGADGKYYNYESAKDLVQKEVVSADGTKTYQWFNKADVLAQGDKAVAVAAPATAEAKQLTLVNINGAVDTLTTLQNVKSGLGVAVKAPTTPVDAEKQKATVANAQTTAKDRVNGTKDTVGLKNLPTSMKNQAATLGDLQDVALTGFEFVGDTPNTPFTTMLGQTVSIKGAGDAVENSAADNIKSKIDGNTMKLQLRSDVKNLVSVKGANTEGKITFEDNDGIGIEGNNAKVVLTPSVTTNADNSTTPTLTLTGANGGKVTISGVTDSPDPKDTDAVSKKTLDKSIKDLMDSISRGKDGRPGFDGLPGPAGHDHLTDKGILDQVMALREGTAGTVVYTDAEGNRLVYGPDGQYHIADDVKGMVFVDGKWYRKDDADNALTGNDVPANVTPAKLVIVNNNGSTILPYALNNVAAAIPAATGTVTPGAANGASQAAMGLTDKHQAVTAGDLKRVAEDGFTFTADSVDALHQVLGSTLKIEGSRSANATDDINTKVTTANLLNVETTTSGLEIQLNKALTGLTSVSGTPDKGGNTGKVDFVNNGITIGGTGRDDVTISLNGTPEKDDGSGKKTPAQPGLDLGNKPLTGVAGYEDGDDDGTVATVGNVNALKSAGLTFVGNNTDAANMALGSTLALQGETSADKTFDAVPQASETAADNIAVTVANKTYTDPATLTLKLAKHLRNLESVSGGTDNAHGITLNQGGLGVVTTVKNTDGTSTTHTVVMKPTGGNNGVTLSDGNDKPVRLENITSRDGEGKDLVNVGTLNTKVNELKNLIDGKGPTVEGSSQAIPGPRGKDGLDGKLIDTVNGLRQGLGGTVVYTDKAGKRLVQAQDEQYYYKDDVKNLEFNKADSKWYEKDSDGKPTKVADTQPQAVNAEDVILSLVNADNTLDTTTPYALTNVKSGLGLDVADTTPAQAVETLKSSTVKANQVATAADMQAMAKTGLTVTTNLKYGETDKPSFVLPLTGTLPIIGKANAQFTNSIYSADNVATTLDNAVVRVGFAKEPTFESLGLGGKEGTPDVTIKPSTDGTTLTFTPGVVIDGIKANPDDLNALITKKQFEKWSKDTEHRFTVPTTKDKANNGPAGKDGLNGKSLGEIVEGLLQGEAGTVVYTTPGANGAAERVVKADDGKFYKSGAVDGLVYENGAWKKPDANDKTKLVDLDPTETQALKEKEIGSDKVNLSLVNSNGEVTQPVTLGNLKSALGDNVLAALHPEDPQNAPDASRAATAADLKKIAQAGISFKGNGGTTLARALGSTVKVLGTDGPFTSPAADNLNVAVDADSKTLNLQLAKDLKNLDGMGGADGQGHISFKPDNTIGIDGANGNTITMKPEGTADKPVLNLGGTTETGGQSGPVQIKNLANGEGKNDAVTKGQLDEIKASLAGEDSDTPLKRADGQNGKNLVTKTIALMNGNAGPVVYTKPDGTRLGLIRAADGKLYQEKDLEGKTLIGDKWYNVADIGADGQLVKDAPEATLTAVDPTKDPMVLSLVNGADGLPTSPVTLTNVKGALQADGTDATGATANTAVTVGDVMKVKAKGLVFEGNVNTGDAAARTVALGQTVDVVGATFAKADADYSADNLVTTFTNDHAIQVQFKTTPQFSTVKVGDTVIKNVDGKLVTQYVKKDGTTEENKLVTVNDLTSQFFFYVQADDGTKEKVFLRAPKDVNKDNLDTLSFKHGLHTFTDLDKDKKTITMGTTGFAVKTEKDGNGKPISVSVVDPNSNANVLPVTNVKTLDVGDNFKNLDGNTDLVNEETLRKLLGDGAFKEVTQNDGTKTTKLDIDDKGAKSISEAIANATQPTEYKTLEIGPDKDNKIHLTTSKDEKSGGNKLDLTGTDNKAPVVISGVADGSRPSDMANVNILNRYAGREEGELRRRASASTASAMAAANLPEAYQRGQRGISIAGATYEGEQAVAIGMSATADNGKWSIRGSLTTNRITTGANVGVSFFW